MNKDQKKEAVKEIGTELESSSAVFAVDYRGISVPQAAELRGKLADADASFTVVKNRLAKRVTSDSGAEALDEHLVGPTALTYVRGDAVLAAKAITDFIKEHEILVYKGGIMDGEPLDAEQFMSIARLPGVDVLRGQLVGMTAAPLTGVVRGLNGLISGLASQLGQLAEQGLVGKDEPEAAAEPDEPETEAEGGDEPEAAADGGEEAEAPVGDPAPGTGGEQDVEAPAEDAGDSDNPGGETEVVPDEGDSGDDDADADDDAEADTGDDEKSEDETDNDNQED